MLILDVNALDMERTVIVFGATGATGTEICKALSQQSIRHFAFVRPGSESKIETKDTEVVVGNALDPTDVKLAIAEQTYTDIIISLGSRDLKGGYIRSEGTNHILDGMKTAGLDATVHVISAHGVRESRKHLKWYEKLISGLFLKQSMTDHDLQENAVVSNTDKYHIIRPVALKNGPATGNIHTQTAGKLPNGTILRADLAKYLVDSMLSNTTGVSSVCSG